jgi:hypothetical protein
MHFVAVKPFTYDGVQYNIGDGVYDVAFAALKADFNFNYYSFFVIPVIDSTIPPLSESYVEDLDMPLVTGYYSVPANASTSGSFSTQPVRIIAITNTDSNSQGATLNLYDTGFIANISTAHRICSLQLGSSQSVPRQVLTSVGLCWEITSGVDGGTTLNSTGGIDIDYAAV